ncbi:MAG: hypothetical protein INQ03_10125 [Candidatus Heimdallarchaeota archaeon]|nr:hypothetical protein [Candidatus Heimdallarchaeota archaeon]
MYTFIDPSSIVPALASEQDQNIFAEEYHTTQKYAIRYPGDKGNRY